MIYPPYAYMPNAIFMIFDSGLHIRIWTSSSLGQGLKADPMGTSAHASREHCSHFGNSVPSGTSKWAYARDPLGIRSVPSGSQAVPTFETLPKQDHLRLRTQHNTEGHYKPQSFVVFSGSISVYWLWTDRSYTLNPNHRTSSKILQQDTFGNKIQNCWKLVFSPLQMRQNYYLGRSTGHNVLNMKDQQKCKVHFEDKGMFPKVHLGGFWIQEGS